MKIIATFLFIAFLVFLVFIAIDISIRNKKYKKMKRDLRKTKTI